MIRVVRHPCGRRVYLFGRVRAHHGATGLALIAVGVRTRTPALVAVGLLLVADDWHDRPWLKDNP